MAAGFSIILPRSASDSPLGGPSKGARGQRQQTPDLVMEIKANANCPTQASGQLRKYMESLWSVELREKHCHRVGRAVTVTVTMTRDRHRPSCDLHL